jgi:hypothetical protein
MSRSRLNRVPAAIRTCAGWLKFRGNENRNADIGADYALPLQVHSRRRSISIILHDHGPGQIRVRCHRQLDLSGEYGSRGSREIGVA